MVSGLEMAQNSQRTSWTAEKVDRELRETMSSCFKLGLNTAKEFVGSGEEKGKLPSLLVGSNIAGFCKVVAAIHAHGDWW